MALNISVNNIGSEGYGNIGSEGGKSLSELLKVNNTLTGLSLYGNKIGSESVKSLSNALRVNNTLTTLNIYGNRGESFTTLDLSGNNIGSEGVNSLSEVLKVNNTLKTISLYDNIDSEGIKSLSEALKVNNTLTTLNIYDNIDSEGIKSLSEALRVNNTLTTLNIYGLGKIGSEGPVQGSKSWFVGIQTLREMHKANIILNPTATTTATTAITTTTTTTPEKKFPDQPNYVFHVSKFSKLIQNHNNINSCFLSLDIHPNTLEFDDDFYTISLSSKAEALKLLELDGTVSFAGTCLRVEWKYNNVEPYFARQNWIPPNYLIFFKNKRQDYVENMTEISEGLKRPTGSSYQIAEYKHKFTNKIWIGKIPGSPIAVLCKEIVGGNLYHKLGIPTSMVSISKVEIFNENITKWLPDSNWYAVVSHKKQEFVEFGVDFVNSIKKQIHNNEIIHTDTQVVDFWHLLVIAHWFGDIDVIGTTGSNAGYLKNTNPLKIWKIDPGFFGEWVLSPINKVFHIAPNLEIEYDDLHENHKLKVMESLKKICCLSTQEISKMVEWATEIPEDAPDVVKTVMKSISTDIINELVKRKQQLQQVFGVYATTTTENYSM